MNAFTDLALARGHYPVTPGHKTDGTSKEAAATVAIGARKVRIAALHEIANEPLTADEVAFALNIDRLLARPRVSELKKFGYVEEARLPNGKKERRENVSGMKASVWKISEAGAAALRSGTVR